MPFRLLLTLSSLLSLSAFAEVGGPSAYDGFFFLDFYRSSADTKRVTIDYNGENIVNNVAIASSGFDVKSFSRAMKPGVLYPLKVTRDSQLNYGIGVVAPEGYMAEINGELKNAFYVGNTTADSVVYQVALRSLAASDPGNVMEVGQSGALRIGDIGWEVGLGRMSNGNGAGFIQLVSKTITPEVFTRTGLGVHLPPNNAGEIHSIYQDLNLDGVSETIRQIRSAQCLVDFVDTVTTAGQVTAYEIRFYRDGTFNSGTGLYTGNGTPLVTYTVAKTGSTSLGITKADAWGTIVSNVTSVPDGSLFDWTLNISGGGYTKTTTINGSAISGGRREDIETRYTSMPSGMPTAATKIFKSRRDFKSFAASGTTQVSEKLIAETQNLGVGGQERTEKFGYWSSATDFDYGLVQFREGPFGDWNLYGYEGIFYVGQGQTFIHDFVQWSQTNRVFGGISALIPRQRAMIFNYTPDNNDTLNFNLGTTTVSNVLTAYNAGTVQREDLSLVYGWDEFKAITTQSSEYYRISSANKYVGRKFSSPLTFPLDYSPSGNSNNFIELNRVYNTPNTVNINGTNDQAVAWSARYIPSGYAVGFDKRLAFKPYMTVSPDDVKKAYGYAKVSSYEGIPDAWVEVEVIGKQPSEIVDNTTSRLISITSAATGNTFNADFSKPFLYEMAGRLVDSVSYPGALRNAVYADAVTRYVSPANIVHGGVTVRMDAVQLVVGKSVKTVKAFNARGELKREERWVYNSSGSWRLAETLAYTPDSFGRVVSIVRIDGSSQVSKTVYEAAYTGLLLDWEIGATGIRTTYTYDGLGRIAAKVTSAPHGRFDIPSSLAVATKMDVMDRAVELVTGGLAESMEYDGKGMLLSSTDINGLPSTFAYSRQSGAGMKLDITHPGGATESRIYSRKGSLKSVTGTGVVATNYTYSYDHGANGTGNLQTRVDAVLISSNSTRHPWATVWTDWTGRTTREENASPASQSFLRTHAYNGITTRLDEIIETQVSADNVTVSQAKSRKFGYDAMGFTSTAGIDVDGGGLAASSTDRLATADISFVTIGGDLFEQSATIIYPEDGSSNAVTTITKSRITGLGASVLYEKIVEDIHGNASTTVASVDRSTSMVTMVTSHNDSTSDSSTSVMGLDLRVTSRQGRSVSIAYDNAGRVILETPATGSRSFSERTAYESGKARPWKVTTGLGADGSGTGYTTTYAYDIAGRVSSIIDPNGGTQYFGYNSRSQVVKKWGSATQPEWYEYDPDYGTLLKQHTWPVLAGSAPDIAGAVSPPAGSSIVRFVRDNASGLVIQRTDAFNMADARVTDYTYDALSQLRTTLTPQVVSAGTHSVVTPRITVTCQYHPKTSELTSLGYSGSSAPSLAFTWHRSGEMKTVTEGGTSTRIFNHDHSGNGVTALQRLSEDLPSYYATLPALAANDSETSANRIAHDYTATGIKGLDAGTSVGVASGGASGLSVSRSSMAFSWSGGLIEEASFDGANLEYGYESGSAMPNRRTVSNFEETRGFDATRDLLSWIKTTGGGRVKARFEYSLDSLGRRDNVAQSGLLFSIYGGNLFSDFGYDSQSHLTSSSTHVGASIGTPVLAGRSFGYSYDLANNRRGASRPGSPGGSTELTWNVNALNQVTTRQTPQWAELSGSLPKYRNVALVPAPGNPGIEPTRSAEFFHAYHTPAAGTTVRKALVDLLYAEREQGSADPANPPHHKDLLDRRTIDLNLRPPTETLKYDGRGNLCNDAWWNYTWDGADRLTSVQTSAAAITAGFQKVKLTFLYDWMGRRYSKQSHVWNTTSAAFEANPNKITLFWWNDWNLIREATFNVTAWTGATPAAAAFVSEIRYHWGLDLSGVKDGVGGVGGVGGLVGIVTRQAGQVASAPLFPAYDGNGNIVALIDAAGAEKAVYEYDPYGRLLRASGPGAELNPFRFATKYFDKETKLVYYNERYYSPELGRFLSNDPILEAGGSNLYAYTRNNPANSVDVLGRYTSFIYAGGGGGYSSGGGYSGGRSSYSYSVSMGSGLGGLGGFSSSSRAWAGSGAMNPLQGWSSDNIKQIEEASASMPQWFQSFGRALYGYDESPFLVASVMMRDPVLRTSALAGKGFLFDGLGGAVNGLWKMVSSPIQTAKGIGSAIANYDQTWGGIKKGLSDFGGRLASGDPTAYGQSGFEIASLFFPAAKASELSHLKYLSKGDEALKLAKAESLVAKTTTAIRPYFPANNGFLGATEKQFLMPGQTIDRFGGSGYSRFFSLAGTSEAARALPAGSAGQPLRSFEVMKPFPVDAGTVAPAFGQLGLGQQFVSPVRLETLLKRGILRKSP